MSRPRNRVRGLLQAGGAVERISAMLGAVRCDWLGWLCDRLTVSVPESGWSRGRHRPRRVGLGMVVVDGGSRGQPVCGRRGGPSHTDRATPRRAQRAASPVGLVALATRQPDEHREQGARVAARAGGARGRRQPVRRPRGRARRASRGRFDDGDADLLVGPRLPAEVRVRVLREALAAADREAVVVAADRRRPGELADHG